MYPGERFNAGTHFAGFLLALFGAGLLLGRAASPGALVFCIAVIALYAASTLCHSTRGAARAFWERIDHATIFLLIAGTCTPFALAAPAGSPGPLPLLGVWTMAAVGVWRELRSAPGRPSVALYVGMGWMAVVAAVWTPADLSQEAVVLLLAGAACYTGGTWFYLNRRGLRHAHGMWHLAVLAGTACHYFAVATLPGSATARLSL